MWLLKSFIFDCLKSDLFVYFNLHILEVETYLKLNKTGSIQVYRVESGKAENGKLRMES